MPSANTINRFRSGNEIEFSTASMELNRSCRSQSENRVEEGNIDNDEWIRRLLLLPKPNRSQKTSNDVIYYILHHKVLFTYLLNLSSVTKMMTSSFLICSISWSMTRTHVRRVTAWGTVFCARAQDWMVRMAYLSDHRFRFWFNFDQFRIHRLQN